jgi:hypothetical protein
LPGQRLRDDATIAAQVALPIGLADREPEQFGEIDC